VLRADVWLLVLVVDFLEADLVEVDIDLDSKVDAGGPDQGGETVGDEDPLLHHR
jgi:hypothetical protein